MENKRFHTPILFLIFNRPATTEKVFERIRQLKPRDLYVSADGPRSHKPKDKELCETTRAIIKRVDWECDVKTRYSEFNLGCKIGVSSGIDWFFEQVDAGIILEDDCLPDPSFFGFCEQMLEHFRYDERVMHIGGSNFQDGNIRGDGTYYFSRIVHVWGWATWKRAWKHYDVAISTYPKALQNNQFRKLYQDHRVEQYWLKNFNLVYSNKKDTWDVQWMYAVSEQEGLSIIPNHNLISNIGFETDATHTFNHSDPTAKRKLESVNSVIHPSQISPDTIADTYTFKKYLQPNKFRKLWRLLRQYVSRA